jgi:hypothetical protein
MSRIRVHAVCFATVICGAFALAPASAGAHPRDCAAGTSVITPAPSADLFNDWTGEERGCLAAPASGSIAAQAASDAAQASDATAAAPAQPAPGSFTQVGHNPLMNRGMNAAIAVSGDYAYIGSRTDLHPGTPAGGIMVVDISQPSSPRLLSRPFDAKAGESSRELRVWQSQHLLIVLNTNCGPGPALHLCTQDSVSNIRFYDISGANAARPRLLNEFHVDTHEFFLWQDPANPKRALIFAGNATSTCDIRGGAPSCPFSVWDISSVPSGGSPVTLFSGLTGYTRFPAEGDPVQKPAGGLHSLTITNDGSRAYWALLTGGFAVVDVSDFAAGAAAPHPRLITANESRPTWPGPGAHSAVKLWGRDTVWVSDEVYGTITAPGHGCPWGWGRIVDISDPQAPTVKAEYRERENDPSTCANWNPPRTSYSAHNPTLTPHIVFSTWHSEGMEAVSLEDPLQPTKLAQFLPKPLKKVTFEDPRLSSDPDTGRNEKVVMWSYAIVKDGLIYVIDLRNGLYVLRYRGPFQDEVSRIRFLEGNSNQGDALCYEPVGPPPASCS